MATAQRYTDEDTRSMVDDGIVDPRVEESLTATESEVSMALQDITEFPTIAHLDRVDGVEDAAVGHASTMEEDAHDVTLSDPARAEAMGAAARAGRGIAAWFAEMLVRLVEWLTRQILNVKTRVLPHKGRGCLAGSTEMTVSSMRKHHDDAHSLKEGTPYIPEQKFCSGRNFQMDEAYEYRAPKYFDFVADETEDKVRATEHWFEAGASHALSPKSFEFPLSKDLAAKSADGGSSTPKIHRPSPAVEVINAAPTRVRSTMENELRIPKGQGNASTGSKTVHPSSRMQSLLTLRKSVIKEARDAVAGKAATTANDIAHENQAVKKQKLDDGRTRQILNVKTRVLPHKGRGCLAGRTVMTAEMSGTRDSGSHHNRSTTHEDAATELQRRPKLTLTRPKEPEFQTAHRVREVRLKNSSELEEEMLAKIPKFRARPFNKKIAEAPSFPPLPRTAPQLPEFNEFHLKTMERASRHADACSEASSVGIVFKAKPLNKKILESKGDIGMFIHPKSQATMPKEFHFCTDDRLGPPAVEDLLDKPSLYSESSSYHDKKDVPRLTIPNPFNLHTDERGHGKERQLEAQLLQKKLEEEKARNFKANPYPYSTDYPVVPPKPEPKPCTRPEGFQLESLVRHDVEQQRLIEERERMAKEEAQKRIFKAQPILKEDPNPLPQKEQKPLTEVQQFELHVDERAIQRSEFDTKMKEKEIKYKRMREENEFTEKIEQEMALKKLRRTLVPQARSLPKFYRPFRPQRLDEAGDQAQVATASGE